MRSAHSSQLFPHNEGFKLHSMGANHGPEIPQSLFLDMYFENPVSVKKYPRLKQSVLRCLEELTALLPAFQIQQNFMNTQPGGITLLLGDKGRLLHCWNGAEIENSQCAAQMLIGETSAFLYLISKYESVQKSCSVHQHHWSNVFSERSAAFWGGE